MAFQPDMVLQFAHFLADTYSEQFDIDRPKVTVDCFVALNGRASQRLINPDTDLAAVKDSFRPKAWILPFKK